MMTKLNRTSRAAVLAATGLTLIALAGCNRADDTASDQSTATSGRTGAGTDQAGATGQATSVTDQEGANREADGCGGDEGCGEEHEQTGSEHDQRRSEQQ